MMNRKDQAALFNLITKEVDISTKVNEDSEFVSVPVNVYWGSEPATIEYPAVIITFTSFNIPVDRAMGDIWANSDEGIFFGFQGKDMMLIKVKGVDLLKEGESLSKQDIVESIMRQIYNLVMWNWQGVLEESAVSSDKYPIHNVSNIINEQVIYELQTQVAFTNIVGGIPPEEGILDITAPFITNIKINMGILPNTNQIEISV